MRPAIESLLHANRATSHRMLISAAALAALVAACGGADPGEQVFEITYSASGVAPLNVTYAVPGQPQLVTQTSPGDFELTVSAKAGDELFISATTGPATFVVTGIAVNGVIVQGGAARGQATAVKTCC